MPQDRQDQVSSANEPRVSRVLERNIDALLKKQVEADNRLGFEDRIAAAVTGFFGSMRSIYLHAVIFAIWVAINTKLMPFIPVFDPSLVTLAVCASLEAIFISTFVLISQNRMAARDDKRADLALQISLLNEHETTRLVALVADIADALNVRTDVAREEIEEMKQNVSPEHVLDELERKSGDIGAV